ncbi:HD-GYP domain-containing protein [Magnetococcus sp. PR-3]|uniref:HD-GYP domain-containing protein n=1 Tax=Magnetococcus sp. PR-3 TaxID=3120355 RepID=UPI002FCE2C78
MDRKPSIKTITLKKLIGLAFLFVALILVLIGFNFRALIVEAMIDKATTLAQSVEVGITSHMIERSSQQKQLLVQRVKHLNRIKNLQIIRSNLVNAQFNLPHQPHAQKDPLVAQVFTTGLAQFITPELDSPHQRMRVLYPYRARASASINCLNCHQVAMGTVLAVIDFEVDLDYYLGLSTHYLYTLLILFLGILVVITYALFRVIDRTIKEPLEGLIEKTRDSYTQHIPIDLDLFESIELDYFADKINAFNDIVLRKNQSLQELYKEIEATQREVIHTMGYVGETRSKETAKHVERVSEFAFLLAQAANLSPAECVWLRDATPMHDIGKVGISDTILHKSGPLTDTERQIMQQHAQWGHEMFCHSERPLLQAASIIALQHHERWDGLGYPQGLKGEKIHIYGRIVAVADVFDALSSKRCYKEPWPLPEVFDYFRDHAGTQFDPELVGHLLHLRREVEAVLHRLQD